MAIGKRLKKAREGVDREKLYPLADAIKMVKERAKSKFDETIEIAINLGVVRKRKKPRLRVLTSSAPKTWSRRCRAATSISIAVSPPPT
jgi:ribosomal protein L1